MDAALAYVFWHAPREGTEAVDYERAHRGFLQSLLASPPGGLERIRVFRTGPLPWLQAPRVYEDWYLIEDSSALDGLNEAAVSGDRRTPHDRVAAMAGEGTAGLYRVRLGKWELSAPKMACWLSKPGDTDYRSFYDSLRDACRGEATLWGRQMVLGPTPEFCLHLDENASIPCPGLQVPLETIF